MKTFLISCCLIAACMVQADAESRITQTPRIGDPFRALDAFNSSLRNVVGDNPKELAAIAQMILRKDTAHQALQSVALATHGEDIALALAQTKAGKLVASQILAVDAIMRRQFDLGLERIPQEAIQDADIEEDGEEEIKEAAPNPVSRLELSPINEEKITQALIALITDSNQDVRSIALIAAANYAIQNDDLRTVVLANSDDAGPAPGAKLLYMARTGEGADGDLIELAFSTKRRQPATIKSPGSDLIYGYMLTPSSALACEALGAWGYEDYLSYLHEALQHKDIRTQIEAARALEKIGAPESASFLSQRIEDCEWPVYLAAAKALTRCRHKDALGNLIHGLKGVDSRFRQHLLYAISAAAGNQYGKQSYEEWWDWWQSLPTDWDIDHEASDKYLETYSLNKVSMSSPSGFYGLPVVSSRISFVVDRSGSMRGERIETLMSNISETLQSLMRGARVNIISYDHRTDIFSASGVTQNIRAAIMYVRKLKAEGGTNIYDATLTALRDPSIDSLYLLTDGTPSGGQFRSWKNICASVTLLNRYRPIAFHTVSFQAGAATAQAMKQVSDMNEGSHVAFD